MLNVFSLCWLPFTFKKYLFLILALATVPHIPPAGPIATAQFNCFLTIDKTRLASFRLKYPMSFSGIWVNYF